MMSSSSRKELDEHDKGVLGDFRLATWKYAAIGYFGGGSFGVLILPLVKHRIGANSFIAVPLVCGALFGTIGSSIAASKHAHSVSYVVYKRRKEMESDSTSSD